MASIGRYAAALGLLLRLLVVCQVGVVLAQQQQQQQQQRDYCYFVLSQTWASCNVDDIDILQQQPQSPYHDVLTSFMNIKTRLDRGVEPIRGMAEAIGSIRHPSDVIPVMALFHQCNLYCGLRVIPHPGKLVFTLHGTQYSMCPAQSRRKQFAKVVQNFLSEAQQNRIPVTSSSMKLRDIAQQVCDIQQRIELLAKSPSFEATSNTHPVDELGEGKSQVKQYLAAIGAPESTLVRISSKVLEFLHNQFGGVQERQLLVDRWKHYLMWHLLRGTAPFLTKSMGKLYRDMLALLPPESSQSPAHDVLAMNMERDRSFISFKSRVNAVWRHLRSALSEFFLKYETSPIDSCKLHVYSQVACDDMNTDAERHILENLFEVSVERFHERLNEHSTSQYSFVITSCVDPSAGCLCWQRDSDWPTKEQSRVVLGISSGDVQLEFHTTNTGGGGGGGGGDRDVCDPANDFVAIGTLMAEWMLETIASIPYFLFEFRKLPIQMSADTKSMFREKFAAFRLLCRAFHLFLRKTNISIDGYQSQMGRFATAYKDALGQPFAVNVRRLFARMIDEEIKSYLRNLEDFFL